MANVRQSIVELRAYGESLPIRTAGTAWSAPEEESPLVWRLVDAGHHVPLAIRESRYGGTAGVGGRVNLICVYVLIVIVGAVLLATSSRRLYQRVNKS
jgi:hypothetical protein